MNINLTLIKALINRIQHDNYKKENNDLQQPAKQLYYSDTESRLNLVQ